MPKFDASKHYWGSPCKYGHDGLRRIKGGDCVWCSKERSSKWAVRNPDKNRKVKNKWGRNNPECGRRNARNYQRRHPERRKQNHRNFRNKNPTYYKLWREANPDKIRRYYEKSKPRMLEECNKRRAAKAQATPSWYESELCKEVYSKAQVWGSEVDHIVPLRSDLVCGLHCWDNLQILPMEDNRSKGNRDWPDSPYSETEESNHE